MCEIPGFVTASAGARYALSFRAALLSVTERLLKRHAMNSPRHISRTAPIRRATKPRSMLAMISRGLARLSGTRRANEMYARERLQQLARLEWELDRRVREMGEW